MGTDRALARRVLIGVIALAAGALAFVAASGGEDSGQLIGIVVAVDGDLTRVESFELLADGDRTRFEPWADGEFDFPLPHLRDHMRTGDPVVIEFERMDGVMMATRISDAG
jgi:hypothetical protein